MYFWITKPLSLPSHLRRRTALISFNDEQTVNIVSHKITFDSVTPIRVLPGLQNPDIPEFIFCLDLLKRSLK
jgi:hypothetical protein